VSIENLLSSSNSEATKSSGVWDITLCKSGESQQTFERNILLPSAPWSSSLAAAKR
jgi:hypothetical protein